MLGCLDLRDALGDEVVVLYRHQRQIDVGEPRDFASPQAGRVDQMISVTGALGGDDVPPAVGTWIGLVHRALAIDLRAAGPGRLGESLRYAAGVDVPACGLIEDPEHAAGIENRRALDRFRMADELRLEAEADGLRTVNLELFESPLGAREGESANVMKPAGLPAFRFELRIELETVLVKKTPCWRWPRNAPVPAAACQVDPEVNSERSKRATSLHPDPHEVVEHAATGYPAANDRHPHMGLHCRSLHSVDPQDKGNRLAEHSCSENPPA